MQCDSTVLKGDVLAEASKLKQEIQREIVVYASRPLVRTLMEHNLVDELRLMVFPVVLGAGEHLFGDDGEGSTDGSHPDDLGFMRQADIFAETIGPLLKSGK